MFTLDDVKKDTPSPVTKLVSFRVDPEFLKEFEEVASSQYRFKPTFTQMMVDAMQFFKDAHQQKPPSKGRKK